MSAIKTILIFTDWYYPGYKAGGPIQSVFNLASLLSQDFQVKVVCRNKDLNREEPYSDIEFNVWQQIGHRHEVMYLDSKGLSFKNIKQIVKLTEYNVLYINGIFSFKLSILPVLLANYYQVKNCFVSVRGMLHQSALSVKPLKKQMFLAFARGFGLYKKCRFIASTSSEFKEIRAVFRDIPVEIAPNLPMLPFSEPLPVRKNPSCHFLFLGRISPEKNPLLVLEALQLMDKNCAVTFCGSGPDSAYNKEFQEKLKKLPGQVKQHYIEELPHIEISKLFSQVDVLVLPSLGENFGHAIFESFVHGKPVIIGNNTPWKNIESLKVGIEINPQDSMALNEALRRFIEMDEETYKQWSESATLYAETFFKENNFKERYYQLFS